jgi:ribulose-phosphate 3-epimerase
VVLNPGTPVAAVEEVLTDIDLVLVMSVNPGWGGQAFIPSALDKLKRLRALAAGRGLSFALEIDGGIKEDTARSAVDAGATMLVSGTGVFNDRESPGEAIARLRQAIMGAA